jgi:hypothetical protein
MTRDKATIDHSGSTLDSLLEEDGILGEVEAVAVKRVFRFLARRPADPEIDALLDANLAEIEGWTA